MANMFLVTRDCSNKSSNEKLIKLVGIFDNIRTVNAVVDSFKEASDTCTVYTVEVNSVYQAHSADTNYTGIINAGDEIILTDTKKGSE